MGNTYFGYGEAEYGQFAYDKWVGIDDSGTSVERVYVEDGQKWFETEWLRVTRVTDDQTKLSLLTYIDETVTVDPVALLYVEHTPSLTNKQITRSEGITIDADESVDDVTDIPVNEGDYYRLQLTKYTERDAFDNINIGFVHE